MTAAVVTSSSACQPSDGWQAERDSVADDAGWSLYLARYADLLV